MLELQNQDTSMSLRKLKNDIPKSNCQSFFATFYICENRFIKVQISPLLLDYVTKQCDNIVKQFLNKFRDIKERQGEIAKLQYPYFYFE